MIVNVHVSGYLQYMCEKHTDLFMDAMEVSEVMQSIARKSVRSKNVVEVGVDVALKLLLGQVDLSQRAYNNMRDIMDSANVKLPTYKAVMEHEKTLQVGEITPIHQGETSCECQGYATSFMDTLQRICATPELYAMFEFMAEDQQSRLFASLKAKDAKLYQKLDSSKKTILVRVTGIH